MKTARSATHATLPSTRRNSCSARSEAVTGSSESCSANARLPSGPQVSGPDPHEFPPERSRPSAYPTAIGGPGYADWGSTGGVLNVERCGIRFQLLWRTFVGGNHWDHIHVGARRVGYAP